MNSGCPYMTEDGFNDRNRFPHDHLFIGEIENGKRYPFGVYTKEESDERYAVKATEQLNPLQYSCLKNPTDRGVWWATVHRVVKSKT